MRLRIRQWLVGIFAEILKEAENHNHPPCIVSKSPLIISERIEIHSIGDGEVTIISPRGEFQKLKPGDTYHLELNARAI